MWRSIYNLRFVSNIYLNLLHGKKKPLRSFYFSIIKWFNIMLHSVVRQNIGWYNFIKSFIQDKYYFRLKKLAIVDGMILVFLNKNLQFWVFPIDICSEKDLLIFLEYFQIRIFLTFMRIWEKVGCFWKKEIILRNYYLLYI